MLSITSTSSGAWLGRASRSREQTDDTNAFHATIREHDGIAFPVMERPHTPRAKSIFISYRREDTQDEVDRLYETLSERFSAEAVFRDVDDVEPGSDFTTAIRNRLLRRCSCRDRA
jgi:TIR domain